MSSNKILISSNTAWNLINFRKGIILKLISNGFEVVIVSPKDGYTSTLLDFGCQYMSINIDSKGVNPVNDLYLLFQYLRIFYRERPNVILTYTAKPNIYGSIAATVYSIPIINNISGLGTAFIRGGLLGKIVSFLYKISLRKSKCVFFQNNDDKDLFLKKNLVTKNQVDILPGSGVNLEYYQPTNLNIANQDEFVFLLIARLIWDKGIQEYVDAARLIKKDNLKVRFQILGFLDVDNQTAVLRSDVDSWVEEGIIEYLGDSDDVRSFIDKSDCVVLPSYREGTPKALLEAGAMGKPIITTDVPGCKEVVDDSVNGFLCNVRDHKDLASKINKILLLPQSNLEYMGRQSREKIKNEFDENNVIDKYLFKIDSIINKSYEC